MPLVDYDDPTVWASLYDIKDHREPKNRAARLGYERAAMNIISPVKEGQRIIDLLGLNDTHRICFIGCGFGFLVERILAIISPVVVAIDTSQYIQDNKGPNAAITIENFDVSGGQGRGAAKRALGITGNSKADFCISVDVISSLTDTEISQLDGWMFDIATTVVHLVTVLDPVKATIPNCQDPRLAWRTATEWKALMPNSLIIPRNQVSGEVDII